MAKRKVIVPSIETEVVAEVVEVQAEPEVVAEIKVVKNEGVGTFIKKLINEGLTNKAVLEIVHEQYGNKNTTYACVAWYRNKMKKANAVSQETNALDFITKFLSSSPTQEDVFLAQEELRKYG